MGANRYRINCKKCTTLLQFSPRAAESKLTCPKCGQTMRVRTPQSGATGTPPKSAPSSFPQATPSRPYAGAARASKPASKPVRGTAPAAPTFTPPSARFGASPSASRFAGTSSGGLAAPGSFAAPRPQPRQRSGGMGKATTVLLAIGAAIMGGGALLVLGLGALFLLAGLAGPQSKSAISDSGWTAEAPGRLIQDKEK